MIQTIFYPEQEQAYYDAVAEQDWFAVSIWYRPPIYKPYKQIQSEIRLKEIVDTYNSEIQRVEAMPKHLQELDARISAEIYEKLKRKRHEKRY